MRLTETLGSVFENFQEPNETYREGCFSFQKWIFESNSQDIKWIVTKREFLTLSEQAMEWIDKFDFPETMKLDAKRLIWEIKYDDYRRFSFSSPIVIAMCSLKIVCDLKNKDFFSEYNGCIEAIKENSKSGKMLLRKKLSDASTKERIRFKSTQLLELIGEEKIYNVKRMWGCIDEAKLLA